MKREDFHLRVKTREVIENSIITIIAYCPENKCDFTDERTVHHGEKSLPYDLAVGQITKHAEKDHSYIFED